MSSPQAGHFIKNWQLAVAGRKDIFDRIVLGDKRIDHRGHPDRDQQEIQCHGLPAHRNPNPVFGIEADPGGRHPHGR